MASNQIELFLYSDLLSAHQALIVLPGADFSWHNQDTRQWLCYRKMFFRPAPLKQKNSLRIRSQKADSRFY